MARRDIYKDGVNTRFSSTNQPKNRGRKPHIYTIAKETCDISLDEYRKVVQLLMNATKEEIKQLSDNPDTPIWVVNLCSALLTDTRKGITTLLSELTDRLYGKPKQVTENYNTNTERNKAVIVFTKPKEVEEQNSD